MSGEADPGSAPSSDVPPPKKPPTAMQVVDDWLEAPPTRPPGIRAAFDRLMQGPRSAWVVWTFGIVAPPVLIWLERPLTGGRDVLPYRPYSSLLAFASVGMLLLWRILRNRANGPVAALFAGGCAVATCGAAAMGALLAVNTFRGLGLAAAPGALPGLGLVLLVTAWVLLGATIEALRRAIERAPLHRVVFLALVGGCVLVGSTWGGAHRALKVERTCCRTIGDLGECARERDLLRMLWWFPGVELRMLEGWEQRRITYWKHVPWGRARDPRVRQRLHDAYRDVTGREPPYRG